MLCVILGGRGFLGRHVGKAMAAAGYEVWSVDSAPGEADDGLPWAEGEVACAYADVASWLPLLCGVPDVIVHLASFTVPAVASANPVEDSEVNLIGTLKLLMGLRQLSKQPRVIIASSGGAVYGRPLVVPLTEAHPTMPLGAYGVTKLAIEHHLRAESQLTGLPYRVLRISNPYGEWQRPHGVQGVIAVFAHRALKRQPVEVWGDGSVVRDFLYAGDVGTAFVAAAAHRGDTTTFNIGGGVGISVNEILRTLESLLGHRVDRRMQPARPFDPQVNVLDISLARSELGWAPEIAFEEGVGRSLQWLRGVE